MSFAQGGPPVKCTHEAVAMAMFFVLLSAAMIAVQRWYVGVKHPPVMVDYCMCGPVRP